MLIVGHSIELVFDEIETSLESFQIGSQSIERNIRGRQMESLRQASGI